MSYEHIPVMLQEVLEYLRPQAGQIFIDCTLGGAGYTLALAAAVGPTGKILSFDLDEAAIINAQAEISRQNLHNIILVQDNFKNLEKIIAANFQSDQKFSGVVLDLGLSSAQLADTTRGFSFRGNQPLDMAFGPDAQLATVDIVNKYSLLDLTKIFQEYGEEKRAYQVAKAIVRARQSKRFSSTADLVSVIEQAVPPRFYHKIHPATRIFQALRLETNDELGSLNQVLPQAAARLTIGGRLAVVSFHSGEDRIVKRFFKNTSQSVTWQILTKRPLIPQDAEISINPRARSAKLRVAQKIQSLQ